MKTFYLNGNKESNMSFEEYGQLYNYLLSNYEIEFDTTGEQIVITKEILEELKSNPKRFIKNKYQIINPILNKKHSTFYGLVR